MRVVITFEDEWVLSHRDDPKDPFTRLSELIREKFNCRDIDRSGVSTLTAVIADDSVNGKSELIEKITKLLVDEYKFKDESGYDVEVQEAVESEKSEQAENVEERAEKKPASKPAAENKYDKLTGIVQSGKASAESADEVMAAINALTGADDFKALAAEIYKAADGLVKNDLKDAFAQRAYVFSVDNGYGLSRYLELFAKLVTGLGLAELHHKDTVNEIRADYPAGREELANFEANIHKLFASFNGSRIISFDISDWMGKESDPTFQLFLGTVAQYCGAHIIFFRVPFVEKDVLSAMEYAINDRFCVKALSVMPFSDAQLRSLAEGMVSEKGFTLEEDAWETFSLRIDEEKNDGRFYGIKTVRKVVFDLLYLKQVSNAEKNASDTIISADDISRLAEGAPRDERSGLEQLNDLVGVEEIRKQLLDIVSQIEYACKTESTKRPCIHMRFVGNPGTGKTTIARILGKILKEKGILRKGNFFEVFSRDLCGQFVGQTSPRTAAKCRDAYGSVLFIDEAYALCYSDSSRDYGREAIDTLIAQMENHRSDLVVIMAGYTNEMESLMNTNPGLRSRMPYIINFPNYGREDLAEIFLKMAKGKEYDEEFKNAVEDFFNKLPDEMLNSMEFSNARFVRNLYERTWGKALLRSQMEGNTPNRLTAEDFIAASSDEEFVKSHENKKRKVGF